ncbi:transposase [Serratia ureilytica]
MWYFASSVEAHAPAGRGKAAAEESDDRYEPQQVDSAGRAGLKTLTQVGLREWVRDLHARYEACEKQICFALRVSHSSFRYPSVVADDNALRQRIREFTESRVHYEYRRIHILLRREGKGWQDNHKRIYHLLTGIVPALKKRIVTN